MRVGVLTGGGDCPGLNAVIRAVVRKGVQVYGYEFVGFRDGWRGPLEGDTLPLDVQAVRGILPRGGTILGSSRTNPIKIDGGVERIKDNLAGLGVDALIAIGGEDTLGVARQLHERGVKVVGVPKTIDNDLSATDYTFGFDTAVNIAMEAIDRLHTTAESHHRALICRGHGPSRGLDRPARGHGRRRQRHPHPRAPLRHREGLRLRPEPLQDALRPDHRRGRGRPPGGRPDGHPEPGARRLRSRTPRRHRRASGGRDREAHRQGGTYDGARPHPARRHARRRSTGSWRPASACTPSTRCTTATSARWSACTAPTSCAWT